MEKSSFSILPVIRSDFAKSRMSSLREGSKDLNLVLVISFICIMFAGFFAPEQPSQLASICEKHNSINACQIW